MTSRSWSLGGAVSFEGVDLEGVDFLEEVVSLEDAVSLEEAGFLEGIDSLGGEGSGVREGMPM